MNGLKRKRQNDSECKFELELDLESKSNKRENKKIKKSCEGTQDTGAEPLYRYLRNMTPKNGGTSLGMFGTTRSGKTCLLAGLLNHVYNEDFSGNDIERKPIQVLMTTSPNAEPFEAIKTDPIIFGQGHSKEFLNFCSQSNRKHKNPFHFVLGYDDVCQFRHIGEITSLFCTERNNWCSSLVSTQYAKFIGPDIRGNMNRIILLDFFSNEGSMQACELYLKGFLPEDWSKKRCNEFYRWWTKPRKGTGFFIDNLDNAVFAIDSKRSLLNLDAIIQQFESKNKKGKGKKKIPKEEKEEESETENASQEG